MKATASKVTLSAPHPRLNRPQTDALPPSDATVVTVFNTTTHASTELPTLLTQSTPMRPLSNLGSNTSSPSTPRAPQAIIVGAGFSQDEMNAMRHAVSGSPGAERLAWFMPAKGQPQRPGEAGFMESVVGRAKEALTAWRASEGGEAGGVFGF